MMMLYLTISTLILFSTSSYFVAVLAAATSTTHRRNDDNDQEAPSSMPPQNSQLKRNNDPIRDGRLVYSDESVQDVIFDFRLAYPPYNRKSLDKLLLLPPKQKQQQQQQTNGNMDTDLEEEDAVIVTMAEEMGMAASEDEVVNVNNNDYCDDNSLQNEKSIDNSTIMETNISHVLMEYDYEDTTTTNAHQDIDNAVESSVVEDDSTLFASPEFTNDDDDYDNDEENVTINNDNVTLSSSSSPSLLESQQLEEDYLTTTTTTNADRTTPPQREEEHEITQSNHIMKDDLLDSNSINDNIHLDDTIIVHDDDMSSETTDANSHHQIVDGRSIHDRTSNVSLESLEASYNDLNLRADDDTLSTMQDVVGRQDDSTISTTTIHSSSSTTTTSTISSLTTTTTASSTSNANANRQFVDGLDDLPKLFESVEVPDELDVGADGSSMQEVLVGQGIKILWKHVKNVRGGISSRLGWNKLGSGGSSITADSVWRALPWSNYGSSGSEMEEQDNMSLLDSLLLSNDLTDDRAEKTTSESRWVKTKLESFSLVKSPKAKKIWNFAQRKIVQTRQLLDKIVKLFEGEEDEDDYYDETNESFLQSRLL